MGAATPKAGSANASRGTWGRRARRRPSCFKESEDTKQDKSKDTSATTANDGKRTCMHVHTHTTPDTLTPHTQRWKRECAGKIHTTHTHTHTQRWKRECAGILRIEEDEHEFEFK